MASKKIKQSMAEFNTATAADNENSATGKTVLETLEEKAPPTVTEKTFNDEVKQQLAASENLASENAKLSEENLLLKEKLAEYISEIAELKSSKDTKMLTDLQDENDKYLMKISELTFENAKLTASVNELNRKLDLFKQAASSGNIKAVAQAMHLPGQPVHPEVYRGTRRNRNGYSDWN